MSTANVEALATGALTIFWLVVAISSFRSHGTWRFPATFLVLVCLACTVAELHGVVFSGPSGGQHGDIPVP